MTHLRQRMLDELQRRNYSQKTATIYVHAIEDFAKYFHRSPERSAQAISGSTRFICFATGSCRPGLSRAAVQRCGFSS